MTLKERCVRFRSFYIFPVLAPVILYLAIHNEPGPRPGTLFSLIVAGILLWTLIEYGLHRFVFHIQIPLRNPRLREIVNSSHLTHHASPREPDKILVHPLYAIVISGLLCGILLAASRSMLVAGGIMTGVWAGFLYYEAVHYRVHCSLAGSGFIARQRRTHFYHHFTNNKRCFGVTSPLWDYVFGTTAR